tara:strand:- start:1237 stop:2130 length:894 start_codon:yes stop_codon:yes gene_type:complete
MSNKIDIEILNTCLELLAQEGTIEACLERFPDAAAELEPMLLIASQTQHVGESIATPADAQRVGLGRITDAWAAKQAKRSSRRWRVFRPLAKSWAVAMIAVMVLAFGGWTTSTAAAGSVPGEVLYPVKQAQERIRLVVSFSDRGKAELHAKFAQERTQEIDKLASRGRSQAVMDRTAERMANHTRRAVVLMGGVLPNPVPATSDFTAPTTPSIRVTLDPASGLITIGENKSSRERYVMQERFLRQYRNFQEMQERIALQTQPSQRARMEESFHRSRELLRRAILAMKALEESESRQR